jgi:hypothetical protein
MEHRWGLRARVDEVVHVWAPGHVGASGRLTDVSISGALVRSSLPVHLWSRVKFRFATSNHGVGKTRSTAEAQVVRLEEDGFAVEWSEFAPLVARALIRNARTQILKQREGASTQNAESLSGESSAFLSDASESGRPI